MNKSHIFFDIFIKMQCFFIAYKMKGENIMNKNILLARLSIVCRKNHSSALAEDIVHDMIEEYDTFQELYDYYSFEADIALKYYSQSFNYLINKNITDYAEAIEWGATDITSIAYYYLTEEISDILAQLDNDLWEFQE